MIEAMTDDALERAYQSTLTAAKILGAERRKRKQAVDRIMAAINCADPQYESHICVEPEDDGGMYDDPPSRPV